MSRTAPRRREVGNRRELTSFPSSQKRKKGVDHRQPAAEPTQTFSRVVTWSPTSAVYDQSTLHTGTVSDSKARFRAARVSGPPWSPTAAVYAHSPAPIILLRIGFCGRICRRTRVLQSTLTFAFKIRRTCCPGGAMSALGRRRI